MEHPGAAASDRPLLDDTVSEQGRIIGLLIAGALAVVGIALDELLTLLPALLIALGSLTARGCRTTVEHGAIVRRHARAPLRGASVEIIAPERIRGVEVCEAYDSDAAPGRHYEYWAAVRVRDRRRPIGVGRRHFERSAAERDAQELLAALHRQSPGPDVDLHVPPSRRERVTLIAGSAGAGLASAASAVIAGGRPIEAVWPWAGVTVAGAMACAALLAAAAFTAGTRGTLHRSSRVIALRYGLGRLGSRTELLPSEQIAAVRVTGTIGDQRAVVIATRDGRAREIHRGPDADALAATVRQWQRG